MRDRKRNLRITGLLALVPVLAACGDAGAASGGWTGTVDTLANGAVLVSNPDRGIWEETTRWWLEEELRIGSVEVEGPDLFGSVAALAVDDLGRIYVGEGQALEIRVFEQDGSHLRTIGRKGGGPGELEGVSGMGWGPDGHLWVMDHRNSRLSVFDTTGAYVTSHRREGGFVMIPWRGGFDRQGRVYDVTGRPTPGDFQTVLVRHDAGMSPADTFQIPEFENASFDMRADDGRRMMSAAVPFTPSQSWTFDGNGDVWIGTSDRYRIHRVSFAGDTLGIVEKRFSPVGVTDSEKDERVEALEWFTRQGGEIERSRIPDTKPAFGGFFIDDRDYLWVGPSRPADAPGGFDVFDPAGRYLGLLEFPRSGMRVQNPLVIGDRVYAVAVDDLDVPYVVRYRILGREPE